MTTAAPRLSEHLLCGLLDRILARDETALRELYQTTHGVLRAAIGRIVRNPWDAEEVLQDVYRYVWRNAAAWDQRRGSPTAWLHTIARSRAIDRFRNVAVTARFAAGDSEAPECRSPLPTPEAAHVSGCERRLLRNLLAHLPPAQRELIGLAYFEGYSHTEIASEKGLPLGTVKTRIRCALNRMRQAVPAGWLPAATAAASASEHHF